MLKGLFKPGWQSNSVEKRIQSVKTLDAQDRANQTIFVTLIESDPETSVRQTALNRLSQPEILFRISQTHADAAIRTQAELLYTALIGPKSELTEDEFRALIDACPEMGSSITGLCPHSSLRSELLQHLSAAEQAALIADIEYSETRRLIAGRLSSMADLELARKLLRGKDKSAEKIIKSKLDVLRAEERQVLENAAIAEGLCEKMEYLAIHAWQSEFKGRYLACSKQWDFLELTPGEKILQRYTEAQELVFSEVEQRDKIANAALEQQQLAQNLEAYCYEIASFSLAQLNAGLESTAEILESSISGWTSLSEVVRPNLDMADQYLAARKALESVVGYCHQHSGKQNEKKDSAGDVGKSTDKSTGKQSDIKTLQADIAALHWPARYPVLEINQSALEELEEQKQQSAGMQAAAKESVDKLHRKINSILGSTRRGNIGRAKRDLEASKKAAKHYQGREKIRLDDRLEKAEEAVHQMGDWKDFATEPRYLELCEAMEALAESKAHADKLSVDINDLQKRWKALGYSDSADKHWERFKAAGDKAYEPCALFFKQRRESRRQNLESREPLVSQMQDLLESTDWDAQKAQPDYQQVELELHRLTNEWQKIKDVEQGPGQQQWRRLSGYKSAIYEKLDVVYDANMALKNQLIDQAKALLELEPKEESINTQQQLHMRWKQIGITRRKDDQAAWVTFKATTDNLYKKVQAVRKLKRADEDARLAGYRNITRQVRGLAGHATDLASSDRCFEQLLEEYKALPELPKGLPEKLVEGLATDFQRAKEAYSTVRDRIKNTAKTSELAALAKRAERCTELEKLSAQSTRATAEEIAAMKSKICAIPMTDKHLLQRFAQRFSVALDADREKASQVRRMLCIDLEILLGADSPPEDKELRMRAQLERMEETGIGQGQLDKSAKLKEIELDWLCLPGAEPAIQETLDKRFQQCIKK